MCKKIACIGDSNTYGYDPKGYFGGRYPASVRWTGRVDNIHVWKIVNLGMNGRPLPDSDSDRKRLLDCAVGSSASAVCVMLGTNDLLCGASPESAAERLDSFVSELLRSFDEKSVLVLAPPILCPGTWVDGTSSVNASIKYVELCKKISEINRVHFCDTGKWNVPLSYDGVHFTEEGHLIFSQYIEKLFRLIF